VEAPQPRGQGPRKGAEASPPLVQVHGVHRHLRPVQAVREPRVHGALRRQPEGTQQAAAQCRIRKDDRRIGQGAHQGLRRNHHHPGDEITIIPAKAKAAAPPAKSKPASDDVIDLDDDEEEIDEEMKESNESSPAGSQKAAKRRPAAAGDASAEKTDDDEDEPAEKRPKAPTASSFPKLPLPPGMEAPAASGNGDKSESKTDHEVSGDEEGVEEVEDEDDD